LAQLKLHQVDAAIASLKTSVELDPKKPEAWRNLGLAYVEAHRPEDAAQAFQKFDQLQESSRTPATTD
jgi:cytochrome c-type biogenesis protein CcmH/NrfG